MFHGEQVPLHTPLQSKVTLDLGAMQTERHVLACAHGQSLWPVAHRHCGIGWMPTIVQDPPAASQEA